MVHVMKLKNEPFQKIKSGQKTVELRLFDNKRRQLDIGDDIIFTNLSNADERLAVRVKALYRYASFEELFNEISPEKCGNGRGQSRRRHLFHFQGSGFHQQFTLRGRPCIRLLQGCETASHSGGGPGGISVCLLESVPSGFFFGEPGYRNRRELPFMGRPGGKYPV